MSSHLKKCIKLTWICFVVLFFGWTNVYGQMQMDIHYGSGTIDLQGDSRSNVYAARFQILPSYHVGVSLDFPIKDDVLISVQPGYKYLAANVLTERNFDSLAAAFNLDQVPSVWQDYGHLSTHNITLPVFLKIISDNERWQFHAGIETTLLFSAKLSIDDTDEEKSVTDQLYKTNVFAVVGVGYRFNLFKNKFSFDLLYGQGLYNSFFKEEVDPNFPKRIKAITTEARLSWRFLNSSQAKY